MSELYFLKPVEKKMPWGGETWLNAALPEGSAGIIDGNSGETLASLIERRPELLGSWARFLFGLSHQTHAADAREAALRRIYSRWAALSAGNAPEADFLKAVRAENLDGFDMKEAPKNEAWILFRAGGEHLLVEPQQSSALTLSVADFYTPLTWNGDRAVFRKGDPERGIDDKTLETLARALRFSPLSVAQITAKPQKVSAGPFAKNVSLWRLMDNPVRWPYFTVYQVDFEKPGAAWAADHPQGGFQHLVAVEGSLSLLARKNTSARTLDAQTPVFVPGNLDGGYRLTSRGKAKLLIFSVSTPKGGAPCYDTFSPSPVFLNYTPVPLAFGTSGLRGLVKDITDCEAYINTKGFINYLIKTNDIKRKSIVSIAGDLRPSTDRIMNAVAKAILDLGLKVENLGKIPTPALTYYAMQKGRASVMVTGSHIPFDRNGIKFNKRAGETLKTDEPGILREVAAVRAAEYAKTAEESLFEGDGMLKKSKEPGRGAPSRAARDLYRQRYASAFAKDGLKGKKVVVYEHSAVGRDLLTGILRDFGAEVHSAGRSDEFIPIDTENINEEQLACLEELLREGERALGRVDAVVSTDGDSDRPLLAAAVPPREAGAGGRRIRFMGGDMLGIVTADYLRADAAAVPVSANNAVDLHLGEKGVALVKTRIGSPHVIRAMQELCLHAATRGAHSASHKRVVGWEANGGFLTGSDINGDIAHIRPSGNAPQLRLYAVSSTPERAEEIVRLGLAEPNGLLRRLQRSVSTG